MSLLLVSSLGISIIGGISLLTLLLISPIAKSPSSGIIGISVTSD
jgi:hypothetical protein